jgi:hypothetical protein
MSNAESTAWADRYFAQMEHAALLYKPETDALSRFGVAMVTQTGGMCLAIEVFLSEDKDGPQLLIGEREDTLSWQREAAGDHGWGVAYAPTSDEMYAEEAEDGRYQTTTDSSIDGLLALVERVLAAVGRLE